MPASINFLWKNTGKYKKIKTFTKFKKFKKSTCFFL
nr:MAG TPA: hypothetical protein [Bacteriophage sp.]